MCSVTKYSVTVNSLPLLCKRYSVTSTISPLPYTVSDTYCIKWDEI